MDGWMDGAIGVLPDVGTLRHSHAHDTSHTQRYVRRALDHTLIHTSERRRYATTLVVPERGWMDGWMDVVIHQSPTQ
jgi:hypothetical protein